MRSHGIGLRMHLFWVFGERWTKPYRSFSGRQWRRDDALSRRGQGYRVLVLGYFPFGN
jgi:hypothetical protein